MSEGSRSGPGGKSGCNAVTAKPPADPTGTSEAGKALHKPPGLRQSGSPLFPQHWVIPRKGPKLGKAMVFSTGSSCGRLAGQHSVCVLESSSGAMCTEHPGQEAP